MWQYLRASLHCIERHDWEANCPFRALAVRQGLGIVGTASSGLVSAANSRSVYVRTEYYYVVAAMHVRTEGM